MCYTGANCDPDPRELGCRVKTGLAARPCDLNRNHGQIGGWKKRRGCMKRDVQRHAAVSATASERLEQSLAGRCFYSNRRCSWLQQIINFQILLILHIISFNNNKPKQKHRRKERVKRFCINHLLWFLSSQETGPGHCILALETWITF